MAKNKKLQPLIRDDIKVWLDDRWVQKLMREKLNENSCWNRGFILDGYPWTFTDA